eukprot:2592240-Pyramimonas_sp.AAC.1
MQRPAADTSNYDKMLHDPGLEQLVEAAGRIFDSARLNWRLPRQVHRGLGLRSTAHDIRA